MAWCMPPVKLTPWAASPFHTASATSREAATMRALASCMSGNTGTSAVPRPAWRSVAAGSTEAALTAATNSGVCTEYNTSSLAGSAPTTCTPGWSNNPSSRANIEVSSSRTGAIGCPAPKSYAANDSSQITRTASTRQTYWPTPLRAVERNVTLRSSSERDVTSRSSEMSVSSVIHRSSLLSVEITAVPQGCGMAGDCVWWNWAYAPTSTTQTSG